MITLSDGQKTILRSQGHLLVTGGPGSGKTTISILKAADFAKNKLSAGQSVLFLSFARATVSRVLEAIDEERSIEPDIRKRIEVETYHSFFWQVIKAHGYFLGLPRKITLLAPPAEAIALSGLRTSFGPVSKLSAADKSLKQQAEINERLRLAMNEGRVSFDLFATFVADLLQRSVKIRSLLANAYPLIILDEFQDTNAEQWRFIQALGKSATLLALADPEQRIFDFIGADPARIGQFKSEFKPVEVDLKSDNYRSPGTDISRFGNDVLTGKFAKPYKGVRGFTYAPNSAQAWAALSGHTVQAIARLKKTGRSWSLAILVPTKSMARKVCDAFNDPPGTMPPIRHNAVLDMEGPVLAAEVIAYLLQPGGPSDSTAFAHHVAEYFQGKGGGDPKIGSLKEAATIRAAAAKHSALNAKGKALPAASIFVPMLEALGSIEAIALTGNPDTDWLAVRNALANSKCPKLREIADEARYIRLLDRGATFRQSLATDWRANASYPNALALTRTAFAQEHFSITNKAELGVTVMNMHKAKGKQFDEVIIFEGWPVLAKKKIVANPDRIVRGNEAGPNINQARQNFRVSVTRARINTTILTPVNDPCILLP